MIFIIVIRLISGPLLRDIPAKLNLPTSGTVQAQLRYVLFCVDGFVEDCVSPPLPN